MLIYILEVICQKTQHNYVKATEHVFHYEKEQCEPYVNQLKWNMGNILHCTFETVALRSIVQTELHCHRSSPNCIIHYIYVVAQYPFLAL